MMWVNSKVSMLTCNMAHLTGYKGRPLSLPSGPSLKIINIIILSLYNTCHDHPLETTNNRDTWASEQYHHPLLQSYRIGWSNIFAIKENDYIPIIRSCNEAACPFISHRNSQATRD